MTLVLVIGIEIYWAVTWIAEIMHRIFVTTRHVIPRSPCCLRHLFEIVVVLANRFSKIDLQSVNFRVI